MGTLDFSSGNNEAYSLRGRVYKQLREDILSIAQVVIRMKLRRKQGTVILT